VTGRNIAEAAGGADGIAHSVTTVATAAANTSAGVEQSRQAADELARMSGSLQRLVGQFRY
jgi:methyl-accepting chemotaxis protein